MTPTAMNRLTMNSATWSLRLLLAAACSSSVTAHGGQYRGPGGVVPPGQNAGPSGAATSSGSTSGANSGASGPSSPSVSTGGTVSSAAGLARSSGPAARGAALDDDLTRWEFWWEFGKDPHLHLSELHARSGWATDAADQLLNSRSGVSRRDFVPPDGDDRLRVAEALLAELRQANDRDTVSACLVALAKIGLDGKDWDLLAELRPFLARNDQEQRETAALALGIAARTNAETIDLLTALAGDAVSGRRASEQAAVNERTRAFAVFGLGLHLQRTRNAGLAHRIVELLTGLLGAQSSGRNLKVATIEALGLFPADWSAPAAAALRQATVDALGAYYLRPLGAGEQLIQAHVPPAIARLLGPDAPRTAEWKKTFADELARGIHTEGPVDPGSKVNPHIAQSCAMALGLLCAPWNAETDADTAACRLLLQAHHAHRDHQTRWFALVALGRIGGDLTRDTLLREFEGANQALEQPWCAMALGSWAARRIQENQAKGQPATAGSSVTQTLRRAFETARTPAAIGALAVALGLARDVEAAPMLREALAERTHQEDLAGYLAIGLGLLGDGDSAEQLRALLPRSARRPLLLQQCARALGMLGDYGVVDDLCAQLVAPDASLVRLSSVAAALGQIQDRRSIDPLLAMLQNRSLVPLTRAFAAVALGGVCDKDPVPWNAAYATGCNYRAATETLTDGASGILDIL